MGESVTKEEITRGLRALGIQEGDVILVHSSLSSLGHVEGGADAVVDALLATVGASGTVAVPTHTWDTVNAEQPVFDVRESPSTVGLITETLRRRPAAVRGLHPTHSCAAIGPMAEALSRGHETQVTPCGSKSPYQRLMDCGGEIAFLGVTLEVNTSFHALEEMACLPWLFDRFEQLWTIDGDRRLSVPSRRHDDVLGRDFEKFEPLLVEQEVLRKGVIGAATVRVIDADGMAEVMLPLLARDPFLPLPGEQADIERERYGFQS
jgi:aminoglycoside 3-N-acetyltransferase